MPVAVDYGPMAARTLRAWMTRTGFSADSISAWLAEHGVPVTPQLVSQWRNEAVHLPFAVVPYLAAMGRPADWSEALSRAAANLCHDDARVDDSLTLPRRGMRTLRETSELVTALSTALDDGQIDQLEARRLIDEAREASVALDHLVEALLPVSERRSAR